MQPQLPTETLDYLLSFLQDDQSTLQCCTKVNHVFSELTEKHLYHRIRLTNFVPNRDIDNWKTEKLAKLFTEKPRLSGHVRVLHISIASRAGLKWFVNPLTKEERIGEMLPMFPLITTVILSGNMSWTRLHQEFRDSFVHMLIQTITVVNLSINAIEDFPLPLLNYCKYLKRLSLIEINDPLSTVTQSMAIPYDEPAQLISLDIEARNEDHYQASPTIISWICSADTPQINHLSSLHMDMPQQDDIPQLQTLLDHCGGSLKDVSFHVDENAKVHTTYNAAYEVIYPLQDSPHQVLILYGLPLLRSLRLSGDIKLICTRRWEDVHHFAMRTCMPWFIQLLHTFSNPNDLEHLVFELTFVIDQKNPYMKLDWQPLVDTLISGPFPCLRRIEIHVKHYRASAFNFSLFLSSLYEDVHLSSLRQSGLLSIISHLPSNSKSS